MKNTLTLFLSFLFVFSQMQAQDDAPDFTVTTMEGETINLYETLNTGKYVLVHFFLPHCEICTQSVPLLESEYSKYGCNNNDIVFLHVSAEGSDADIEGWETDAEFNAPIVSGTDGNGLSVFNAYSVNSVPTVVLITPEKELVRNYPFSLAEDVIDIVHGYDDIEENQSACTEVVSSLDNSDLKNLQLFPNPTSTNLNLTWSDFLVERVEIYDIFGRKMIDMSVEATHGSTSLPIENFVPGTYLLTTYNADGINGRTTFQKL